MRSILKVHFQRILSLFVLCVLCVAMVMGGQMTAPIAYADTAIGDVQMDSSNVMDDLQNSTIDGVKFDISNYVFDENQFAQVFMFAEYCYSFYSNLQDNYGLYVYVYNPQRLKFKTNSTLNTISIRAGDDDSIGHTKYMLLYLNQCEIPNYEGMFLKFKVMLSGEQKEQIFDRLASDKRVYDVSEIELVAEGATQSQYYYVGTKYTFEGYAKGYGSDINGKSTLVCTDEQSEALTLDVRSTYYRPDGTSGEAYTRDTLHSVYFAVPQRILDAYPTVSKVHATWTNVQTAPIFVTGNQAVYDAILPYIGLTVDGGDFTYASDDNSPVPYALIASKYIESAGWNNLEKTTAKWSRVEYATGYEIRLYRDTNYVRTVDVGNTVTKDLSEYMTEDGTYDYEVRAVGKDRSDAKYRKSSEYTRSTDRILEDMGDSEGRWRLYADGKQYEQEDGSVVTDQWYKIGGQWYYFGADGYADTGWQQDIIRDIQRIYELSLEPSADYELELHILLAGIWQRLYRYYASLPETEHHSQKHLKRLREILTYLQEHCRQEIIQKWDAGK